MNRTAKPLIRAGVRVQNSTVMNVNFIEETKQNLINSEFMIEQALNYRDLRDFQYRSDFAQLTFDNFRLKDKTYAKTDLIFSNAFNRAINHMFEDSGLGD